MLVLAARNTDPAGSYGLFSFLAGKIGGQVLYAAIPSKAKVVAVGGVSSDNFIKYLAKGAIWAGVGGNLCRIPADGNYGAITAEARKLVGIDQGYIKQFHFISIIAPSPCMAVP